MGILTDLRSAPGPMAGFVTVGLFWGSFAALVPLLKAQVDLSDGGFGMSMFVAALGAVAAMWLAPLADARLGRLALPILSIALATAFLVPAASITVVTFTIGMLMASMASGTLDVVMNARISAAEAQVGRPLMNLAHATFSFGYAGAALAAGLMREAGFGAVGVILVMGTLTLLLCKIMFRDRPLAAPEDDTPQSNTALPWAMLIPGGLIIMIAFMAEQGTEGWSALHLERNLGAGAALGALGPTMLGLTMAIGRLSGHLAVQRFEESSVVLWAGLIAATGACFAAFAPSLPVAYVGFAILGLGVSVIAPMIYAWVGRRVTSRQRTLAVSRISVIGYAGFFIGPPLMGGLSELFGLHVSFLAMGALLLIVSVILIPLLRRVT